ncbi:hypothetical protein CAAN1_07S07184 [[Candida] anglica]|uniref:Uncharacterized protein n=1 Tax=[Candida] anglica TaxID=148631 RepID=A0ABP0EEB2_9ASCO
MKISVFLYLCTLYSVASAGTMKPFWAYLPVNNTQKSFTGISSTINMHYGNTTGLFMATSTEFQNSKVAYFGFQPRPGPKGRVSYSVFGEGTYTSHHLCYPGADAGPGVTCQSDFEWVPGRNYTLSSNLVETLDNKSTVWQGWCRDDVTGERTDIGRYTVDASFGLIKNYAAQWLEQYLPPNKEYHQPLFCTPEAGYSTWVPTFYNNGKEYDVWAYYYGAPSSDPKNLDYCEKQQGRSGTNVTFIPGERGYTIQEGLFSHLYH